MTTLSKFTGLRNQQRPERLAPGSLTACDNVIVDDTSAIETRFGYLFHTSLAGITDAYTMPSERYGYILASGSLYCWDGQSLRTAATGLTDTKLQFAAVGNTLLYAGKNDAGWVVEGVNWEPLRMPMPPQPTIYPTAGDLEAGQYQITHVWRYLATGMETPAPTSKNVEVPVFGGLLIESNPPNGYAADVYATRRDGTAEMYLSTSHGGIVGYYGPDNLTQRTLDDWQTNTYTLPDGEICGLALYSLCLHVAFYDGGGNRTQIVYSQRGSYQAYRLTKETYAVAGKVRQMQGVDEGVLIATDQAVWLWAEDGTDAGTLTNLSRYGCPGDRPMDRDSTGTVAIQTNRGLLTYPPMNDAARLKFIPPKAVACSVGIVQQDGLHLALVTADESGTPYTEYS
jgi:hypothetical protein